MKPSEQVEKETKNTKKESDISAWPILSGSGKDVILDEISDTGTGKTEEETQEEEKLKKDINAYIIESYKAQWSKIVKELSIKLVQTLPDPKDRQEAYKKIRSSLELRLERTVRMKMTDTKKLILQEFLTHVISLLSKKVEELS